MKFNEAFKHERLNYKNKEEWIFELTRKFVDIIYNLNYYNHQIQRIFCYTEFKEERYETSIK